KTLPGVAQVIARGEELPDFDVHCPMMHLPKVFRTELATIPAETPYLFADAARISHWRQRLPEKRGMRVVSVGPELADFSDTAAVVSELDLVITVDTSVAHLAGAMAKPVWILIPFFFDWRWMIERTDTPWYPTARLFRQPAQGDWPSAVKAAREALRALVQNG